MSASQLDETRDKWAKLVGGFILAFGDIELVAFTLWPNYFPNQAPPHNFKERASKLLSHLKNDPAIPQTVCDLLVESLRLADKRNTIAHHPLHVQVFQHSKTGELFTQLAISSEVSDDYISDADLEELGMQARELARSLYRALWPSKAKDSK